MKIYNGNYTVYCHENKINNKKYIGITKQKCKRRWGKEGHGYKTCTYFYHAIVKYGWKNFEHIIIATNLTKSEACNFEKILIKELDTTNSKKGYNIAIGGQRGNSYKRTKEQCEHISQAKKKAYSDGLEPWNKGKHMSDVFKKSCSEGSKGKKLSDETKQKIRNYQKGRKKNPESVEKSSKNRSGSLSPNAKSIYQFSEEYDYITYWDCAKTASNMLNINYSTLVACAHHRVKLAGGFKWEYE